MAGGLGGIVGGFGGSAVGGATVMLLLDDAQFKSALAEDEAKFKSSTTSMGASASKGSALASKGFNTLALGAGIAVAAGVSMAVTFNKTFAQIGALAGKLGMPMDQAKQHILDLSKATGQDANGLAQALYFAASAGLKTSQVMGVVDMSAKAAAMGMGSAQDVAHSLTSILNAYAGTGMSAGQAMNVLTVASKDSAAEMSDFATGLGPVISVAASAGVSLNDLTAGIAQATNAGVPFARAVTGMRFLIQSLVAPTPKATAAFKSLGLTTTQVADMIQKPGGLEKALQMMHDKTAQMGTAGAQAWSAITGGARGAIVAEDLVGKHTAATTKLVGDLNNAAKKSATDFSDAWSKISQSDAIKFQQAITGVKDELIKLGVEVLPAIAPVVKVLGAVLSAVIPLAPEILAMWAAFKGATIIQSVVAWFAALTVEAPIAADAVAAANVEMEATNPIAAAAAAAVGALVAAYALWKDPGLVTQIAGTNKQVQEQSKWIINLAQSYKTGLLTVVPQATSAQQKQNAQWSAATKTLTLLSAKGDSTGQAMGGLSTATQNLSGATKNAANASKTAASSASALAAAQRKATQSAIDEFNAESTLAGGFLAVQSAASTVAGDQKKLNTLRAQGKTGTAAYSTAVLQAINDEIALTGAVDKYQSSVGGAAGATSAVNSALATYGHALGLTTGQINALISSTDAEIAKADALAASINSLPSSKVVNITVAYHQQGSPGPVPPGKPLP